LKGFLLPASCDCRNGFDIAEFQMTDSEDNPSNPVTMESSVGVSEIVGVFDHIPVIYGEDPEAYTQLTANINAAVKPGDFIEQMLARDVIDLFWELTRLRRLKAGLLDANMGKGVRQILSSILKCDAHEKDQLAVSWHAGDQKARDEVAKALTAAGLSEHAIMGQTLALLIDAIDRIDRMTASLEARRGNALREIDRHRAALGAAVRAIGEAADAEFREVD
jgi:hypothetical protein